MTTPIRTDFVDGQAPKVDAAYLNAHGGRTNQNTADIAAGPAANKVNTAALQTNAVTKAKIADDAVGPAELDVTGTPTSATFLKSDGTTISYAEPPTGGSGGSTTPADGSVSTAKIVDGAVTGAKLGANAVSLGKLNITGTPTGSTVIGANGTNLYYTTPAAGGGTTIDTATVDFGYCQSEIGHKAYGDYDETQIRNILQGIKDSGASRVRMAGWWNAIEPVAYGTRDWVGLDRCFNLCQEYDLAPLLVLTAPVFGGTPTVSQYASMCGAVAARYGAEGTGQLQHYEIWNEPNHRAAALPYGFGAAAYTPLLIAASTAIRAADSEAFIIAGSFMSTVDFAPNDILPSTFLQGIYDNGGKTYFDAVSYHWYCFTPDFSTWEIPSRSQTYYVDLLACRTVMEVNDDAAKKIWVTEIGFSGKAVTDPNDRAERLVKQIELLRDLPWVGPFFIYNYRNSAADQTDAENTYGSTNNDLSKKQPIWDYVASINATVKGRVAEKSVTADKLAAGVGGSGGSSTVGIDTFMKPWGMVKAVDATNGPWVADTGITAGTPTGFPTVSGKTFYGWNSGVFNLQSQNWEAAGTATGQNTSGYSAAINKSTPRVWTFGTLTGRPLESLIDVNFTTDSAAVTFVFYSRLADQQGSTTFTDMTVANEINGQMMELGSLPGTANSGTGTKYRTLTMAQARMSEWRAILPGNCYFIGILVDNGSTVRKAPNKFLMAYTGDSWGEAGGCTLASPIGGAWPTGTYRTHFLPTAIIRATNFAMIQLGQGGTGEWNANGTAGDANYVGADGSSVFHSVSRVNDLVTKFGARNPVVLHLGGWNDGTLPPTPVATSEQTRMAEGINRYIAAKANLKLIYATVEPVNMTNGSVYDLMRQGQLAAYAAAKAVYPNNILGWMDLKQMWLDTSNNAGSQRNVNVNQSDTIHLHIKGGVMVAGWNLASIRNMQIDQGYVNDMMKWGL